MKKLTKALLAWVVLILVAFGVYSLFIPSAEDKEQKGREFAESSLKAISQNWDKSELINRSTPALKQKITQMKTELDHIFSYNRRLGSLVRIEKMNLDSFSSGVSTQKGIVANAAFTIDAEFIKGKGKFIIEAIEDDGNWMITRFRISSSDIFLIEKENETTVRSGTNSDDDLEEPLSDRAQQYEPALKISNQMIDLIMDGNADEAYEKFFDQKLKTKLSKKDLARAIRSGIEEMGEIVSYKKMQWCFQTGIDRNTHTQIVTSKKIVMYEKGAVNYSFVFPQNRYDKVVGIQFRKRIVRN